METLMSIIYIIVGVAVLAIGMWISDLFTESVDKVYQSMKKPSDPNESR